MSKNSIITTLCTGQVFTKNTDSEAEAIRAYVVMLRSGVLATDVRPLLVDRLPMSSEAPVHVAGVSFLHEDMHTSTRMIDFVECDH